MGMGEPLANFDEVVEALWRIVDFIGISRRRITLSTAGIVPKLRLFAEKAPEVNLAISLNATTDEERNELMPINKTYPIPCLDCSMQEISSPADTENHIRVCPDRREK